MDSASFDPTSAAFLSGGGEMGSLIRSFDWSGTALGPVSRWPQSLRTSLGLCLNARQPTLVLWGPEMVSLYNDAFRSVLGSRHPRALGMRCRDCWPERWHLIGPMLEDALSRGSSARPEATQTLRTGRGLTAEMSTDFSYSPIYDEAGAVGGIYVACSVTPEQLSAAAPFARLVEATKAIETSRTATESERRRLRSLLTRVPAAIAITTGPDHVFELVNPSFQRIAGVGRELLGRPFGEALPERLERGDVELLDRIYRTGETVVRHESEVLVDANGTGELVELFLNVVLQPLLDADGRPEGIMMFAIDVAEHVEARRRFEALSLERQRSEEDRALLLTREKEARLEAERLNRLKDEFLATVSHELRTPLQAILGWARLLRAGAVDPARMLKGIEVIDRNANAQAQLIEDILDVSRIITGKVRINATTVDIGPLIRSAIDTMRPAADAKRIAFVDAVDPEIGALVADGERLQQVIWNLISNAVKFTQSGGRVEVRADRVETSVRIVVSDTGKGIPEEFLQYVFDRFRQADSTTTRTHGGLGLGLAIVRHLVELHGGTVRAESAGADRGATFTVMLPVRAVNATSKARAADSEPKAASEAARPSSALTGTRVLVVDDEADARDLLVTVLEQFGAEPRAAGSVDEAIALLDRFRPDVLVSDIGMPGEDGYVLIRKIRAREAELGMPWVPAVALTAYARTEDRRRALAAGFQIHVSKPVEPAELVGAIARVAR